MAESERSTAGHEEAKHSPMMETASVHRNHVLSNAVIASRQMSFSTPGLLVGQSRSPCRLDSPYQEPLLPVEQSDVAEEFDQGELSLPQGIFNVANIVVGVGVLSVPYAVKQSGYFALVLFVVVISITAQTGRWIGAALDMASQSVLAEGVPKQAMDFGFLAEVAFGSRGGTFINAVTVLEIWFALVAFMTMNCHNATILWPDASNAAIVLVSGTLSALSCGIPSGIYAYLSLIATVAMLVAAVALVRCTIMMKVWANPYDHLGFAALFQAENIPRSVGIIVFCCAGHPCFCSVKTSLQKPEQWGTCVDLSFMLALLYYGAFGALGFLVFGADLSPTITENLTGIEGVQFWRDAAAVCFLVKLQLTMPLLLNAVIVALWRPSSTEVGYWPPLRVALLAAISGLTMSVALACADAVAVVASLAGSLLTMTTSVLFPAVVHLTLSRRKAKAQVEPNPCGCVVHGLVVVFGVVMAVLGTMLAVQDLFAVSLGV